jgi:predicted DNA binding CopG/RHH family protein
MANFGVSHVLQDTLNLNGLMNRILNLEKLVQNNGLSLPSNQPKQTLSDEEFNSLLEKNEKFKFYVETVMRLGENDLERIKDSKIHTGLVVENTNNITDIRSRMAEYEKQS